MHARRLLNVHPCHIDVRLFFSFHGSSGERKRHFHESAGFVFEISFKKIIVACTPLSLAFSSIFSHSDLFHNGLTGSIPPQMLMLTKLTLLYAPKWNILLSVGHILY